MLWCGGGGGDSAGLGDGVGAGWLIKILPMVVLRRLPRRLLIQRMRHRYMRILPHRIHLHIMQLGPLRHINCHRRLRTTQRLIIMLPLIRHPRRLLRLIMHSFILHLRDVVGWAGCFRVTLAG